MNQDVSIQYFIQNFTVIKMKNITKILSMLTILIIQACGTSDIFISKNAGKEIKIDGDRSDWKGKLEVLDDEQIAVGFLNNEENLFLCLTTNDRENIMKIVSQGLTVWFYPEERDNVIGLNYPQQLTEFPRMERMRNDDGQKDYRQNPDARINNLLQSQSEYSIVDEDNNALFNYPVGSNTGFEVKASYANNYFVYEAKIPIGNNNISEVVVDVLPKEILSVLFETAEIDIDNIRNQMSSGRMGQGEGMGTRPDGGMSGEGMGQSGGRGQRGERPNQNMMDQLEFDLDVKLN